MHYHCRDRAFAAVPSITAETRAATRTVGLHCSPGVHLHFSITTVTSLLSDDLLDQSPRFDLADAERIARELFGVDGRASMLTSERDQNFLIAAGDGTRIVLKIANAAEEKAMLEAQQRAITHLAQRLD